MLVVFASAMITITSSPLPNYHVIDSALQTLPWCREVGKYTSRMQRAHTHCTTGISMSSKPGHAAAFCTTTRWQATPGFWSKASRSQMESPFPPPRITLSCVKAGSKKSRRTVCEFKSAAAGYWSMFRFVSFLYIIHNKSLVLWFWVTAEHWWTQLITGLYLYIYITCK